MNSAAGFTVSETGTLAYRTGAGAESHLLWFDRAGKQLAEVNVPAPYQNQVLSPDLQRIAVFKQDGATFDIWIQRSRPKDRIGPVGPSADR